MCTCSVGTSYFHVVADLGVLRVVGSFRGLILAVRSVGRFVRAKLARWYLLRVVGALQARRGGLPGLKATEKPEIDERVLVSEPQSDVNILATINKTKLAESTNIPSDVVTASNLLPFTYNSIN